MPRQAHHLTPEGNQIRTSSSSIRYATPASLPPAFGVDPLHMWESSVTTSTPSAPPTSRSSHVGSLSTYVYTESGTHTTITPQLFSPRTPVSTADGPPSDVSKSYTYTSTGKQRIHTPDFTTPSNGKFLSSQPKFRHRF
ncbi:hypothetical protein FRC06_002624 [Ceratobasidium sp. 370]|nr:hypothetical protein FRC06_002624 [Ceratobasidium sp. 370]